MFCSAGEDVYLNYKGHSLLPQSNKTFPPDNESKDSPPEIASAEENSIQMVAFKPAGSA